MCLRTLAGSAASLIPNRVTGLGTDHTVDVGFDTQYQFLADRNSVSVMASWITENDTMTSTAAQAGGGVSTHDHLRTLNIKTTYYYDQTYGGTLGFFRVDGSGDPNLYLAAQYGGSASGSPNSQGWIGEVDYIPFNHGGPSACNIFTTQSSTAPAATMTASAAMPRTTTRSLPLPGSHSDGPEARRMIVKIAIHAKSAARTLATVAVLLSVTPFTATAPMSAPQARPTRSMSALPATDRREKASIRPSRTSPGSRRITSRRSSRRSATTRAPRPTT